MTEQTTNPNYTLRMKKGMKHRIHRKSKKYRLALKILKFYSKGFKLHLLALVLFSILLGLMETFQIVLLYPILNASFNLQDAGIPVFQPLYNIVKSVVELPEVVVFCLLFIFFVILTAFTTITYKIISLKFTKAVIVRTKESIFDKIRDSDYRYFVENRQGDILYNVVTSPGKINIFLDRSTRIFADIVVILTIIITLFFLSPWATIILLIGGISFVLVIRFVGNRISYVIGKVQLQSIASENAVISQYVQGLRQIRSVHADDYWKRQYSKALRNYWDKYVRYRFSESLPGVFLQMLFFIAIAIVVIVLFYVHKERFITVIPLIGTFAYSALKVLPRLSEIGNSNMQMMDAYADLERIYEFLNDYRYSTIKNGTAQFDSLKSDILFENVGFEYYKGQDLIDELNLTIHRNKVTALVGHSGSGKSTVVSLLLRYYDVSKGRILVNDMDLREYDLATFLGKVGYVSQDTFIYNDSIRKNIAFGSEYTEDQIIAAAKRANIHGYIEGLPHGYDTIVGDQGLKLSGGEKQRIAIARALIREPEILVLDEATSNLDNESEAIVQESINRISEMITTFIVAHRLSTIRRADVIYVMSKGRIVESGNHDELMGRKGKYWELYELSG